MKHDLKQLNIMPLDFKHDYLKHYKILFMLLQSFLRYKVFFLLSFHYHHSFYLIHHIIIRNYHLLFYYVNKYTIIRTNRINFFHSSITM